MSWNYRVIKKESQCKEVYYEVCEVYYSDEGIPHSFSENALLASEEFDDLLWMNKEMGKAFEKPVLEFCDGQLIETDSNEIDDTL